ncbi:MAG TPA: hypothetical protein VHI13_17555 [Candidatus Kapabacteria bacterium]|nr:hypothetical protein [Candidatus Kapabacteria bacterium]
MQRIQHTFLAALSLLIIALPAFAADTVTVRKVTSGNTFLTSTGERIVLLGLATARSSAISPSDARATLATMIEGQRVVVVADTGAGGATAAAEGRYVYLGGHFVNLEMISTGHALAAITVGHSHLAEFKAAEQLARAAHSGAFSTVRATAVQCSAITRKGTRCLRMTTNLNGRCWQHQ